MSRILFAQVQGDTVSVSPAPLAQSQSVDLSPIARGLAAGADVADKMMVARDSVEVSNTIVDGNAELDRYRLDLDKDPDYASREAKFRTKAEEVRAAGLEKLSRRAADDYAIRFNQISKTMELQVRHEARDSELQSQRFDLSNSLGKLATQSVFAKSDLERQALDAEAAKQIDEAVRTGRLTGIMGKQWQKAFLGQKDAALANELARTNPAAALAALGDPNKFPNLDAATRVQIRTYAQTRGESLSAQARAELRYDADILMKSLAPGMPPVPKETIDTFVKRTGPNSVIGQAVTRAFNFQTDVQSTFAGLSIPEMMAKIGELQRPQVQAPPAPIPAPPVAGAEPGGPGGASPASMPLLPQPATKADIAAAAAAAAPGTTIPPTPQQLHLAQAGTAFVKQQVAQRDADPAAYVLNKYPTVSEDLRRADAAERTPDFMVQAQAPEMRRKAWQSMIDLQRKEGVLEHNITLMTDAEAGARKSQFSTMKGEPRVDLIYRMRDQYGEEWPRVMQQLWKGKPAPIDVQIVGGKPVGSSGNNLSAVLITEWMKTTEAVAIDVLKAETVKEVKDAVLDVIPDMVRTMAQTPDGAEFGSVYGEAIKRGALALTIQGEANPTTAAKRAADMIFYNDWLVVGTTRVPKLMDGKPGPSADDIRGVQVDVIASLGAPTETKMFDLMLPRGATSQAEYIATIKSSGMWLTTGDDRGMMLMAGPGLPVKWADGGNVVIPFKAALYVSDRRTEERLAIDPETGRPTPPAPYDPAKAGVNPLMKWLRTPRPELFPLAKP